MAIGEKDQPLEVVVVEDDPLILDGLGTLIDGSGRYRCTRRFRSMEEALAALDERPPDIVLTDLGLPGLSGIDGIGLLRQRFPSLPILALTIFETDDTVFQALCRGASGYLVKGLPPARLLESLDEVAAGGAPMSPSIARKVVDLFRQFRPPTNASYRLTPQESELLRLLADGHHKKTAADVMGISINTVSFHAKHLYEKLQVHSKAEAVAKAIREGLV
jgi:DNA-binding NarL/FixJ family response regulator